MIKIVALICGLGFVCLSGQCQSDTIRFSIGVDGTIVQNGDTTKAYQPPLTLKFGKEFKDKTVTIFDRSKKQTLALGNAVFEKDLVRDADGQSYFVTIKEDRSIKELPGKGSVKQDTFMVRIGALFSGPFALKKSAGDIAHAGNPPTDANYRAGYILEDALALQKELSRAPRDFSQIKFILSAYKIGAVEAEDNPFLKTIFTDAFTDKGIQAGLSVSGIVSSVGGVNVTNFADGLAKFLIERFKQELSEAFFDKFKADLNNPKFADLKILFPETFKTLQTIGEDIYQYSTYLNTLRQAFIKDMGNGFVNLRSLLQQQKYQDYFNNKNPLLGSVLQTSLYFITSLTSGKHPGEVLRNFDAESYIKICRPANCPVRSKILQDNLTGSIKTVQLLSQSLMSTSKEHYWVPADSARMVLEDPTGLKIYLGLIWQDLVLDTSRVFDISFSRLEGESIKSIKLKQVLDSVAPRIDSLAKYRDYIETLVDKAEALNESIADLKSKKKSEIDYGDYHNFFTTSLDLLEQGAAFIDLPYVDLGEAVEDAIKANSGKILYVARSAGELYVDARTKNYASAVQNMIGILDTLLDYKSAFDEVAVRNHQKEALKNLADLNKANNITGADSRKIQKYIAVYVANPDLPLSTANFSVYAIETLDPVLLRAIDTVVAASRTYDEVKNHGDLRRYLLKYGSFIAAVAQAQNSDDVKTAIEAAALPAGSYTIKQKADWNISVNAYVGYAFDLGNKFGSGIYAPVGFCLSRGKFWGGAASLFLSVIDIGAIVAYRLKDDPSGQLKQDVRLESILSPSAQLVYAFRKLPLAVCAGWRLTPKLFYSNNQNFEVLDPRSVVNLSVLIDIPLLNIKSW